jgi:hypothetical protein
MEAEKRKQQEFFSLGEHFRSASETRWAEWSSVADANNRDVAVRTYIAKPPAYCARRLTSS